MTVTESLALGDARAATSSMTITVLETATIFEGPHTVYRYDLPGSGIADGWALVAVVEQAREILTASWPDVEIIIDADAHNTDVLTRTFLNKGVPSYPVEVARESTRMAEVALETGAELEDEHAGEETYLGDDRFHVPRPAANGRGRHGSGRGTGWGTRGSRRSGRHHLRGDFSFHNLKNSPLILVVMGAVGILIAAILGWVVVEAAAQGQGPGRQADDEAAGQSAEASGEASPGEASPGKTSPSMTAPHPIHPGPKQPSEPKEAALIETPDFSATLPAGFTARPIPPEEGGGYLATGQDPHLRIIFAADPAFGVPAEEMARSMEQTVENDPALADFAAGLDNRVTYVENPGDGSSVRWMTWVEADHHVSVGCHTRQAPTPVNDAACQMAVESVRFHPVPAPPAPEEAL